MFELHQLSIKTNIKTCGVRHMTFNYIRQNNDKTVLLFFSLTWESPKFCENLNKKNSAETISLHLVKQMFWQLVLDFF